MPLERVLKKKRVNHLIKDNDWCSLHVAAHYGSCNYINTDTLYRTYVNIQDRKGNTPLHIAVAAQQFGAVQLLVQHGAQLLQENYNCQTPLELAKTIDSREKKIGSTTAYYPTPIHTLIYEYLLNERLTQENDYLEKLRMKRISHATPIIFVVLLAEILTTPVLSVKYHSILATLVIVGIITTLNCATIAYVYRPNYVITDIDISSVVAGDQYNK